jgi:antirestriction protein
MDEFLIEGFEVVNEAFLAESTEREFLASLAHARSEWRILEQQIYGTRECGYVTRINHDAIPENVEALALLRCSGHEIGHSPNL